MIIRTLTKTNQKHYIQQLLDAVYEQGHTEDPIWLPLTEKDITNKEAFKAFPNSTVSIIPHEDYRNAKEIRANWVKKNLASLVYRENPEQIAYCAQRPLKDCLYQINALFHTCFHPAETNVSLEIVAADKIKLSVTDNDHPFFEKGSLVLPAVDVSLTLHEMVNGREVTLDKEDCVFALNLYSRKTTGRKEETISWNAWDALGLAIALRTYQKNGTRDGLNEHTLANLPPHHHLVIKEGIEYGETNSVPYSPTVNETEQTNTMTSLTYRTKEVGYPSSSKDLILVYYSRFDIRDYLREFFGLSQDMEKLHVTLPGLQNSSADHLLLRGLKEYLNFNLEENIVGGSGHQYNNDILIEKQSDGVMFDFRHHPLLFGTLKVDFNHA